MAPQATQLADLGPDLLAKILALYLLDNRSRAAAALTCKALWRASCLPEVWRGVQLELDLSTKDVAYGALDFLRRRGAGLRQVSLVIKETPHYLLPLLQLRLAGLLDQLPALQRLSLSCEDLALVHLDTVAVVLPRLAELSMHGSKPWTSMADTYLPVDHFSGIERLQQLQNLKVSFDCKRLLSWGRLLQSIEVLTWLTQLELGYLHYPGDDPLDRVDRPWSPGVSRLQRLQVYTDRIGLRMPVEEFASLPSLHRVELYAFSWRMQGRALCALRNIHKLTVSDLLLCSSESEEHVPDPKGFWQALSAVSCLHWDADLPGLVTERKCLENLMTLELTRYHDLLRCLTWSPRCCLRVMHLTDIASHEAIDLVGLSPLTTLTYLYVDHVLGSTEHPSVKLPKAPCMAHLRELYLQCVGLSRIPAELRHADRLQLLDVATLDLQVSRECIAILAGLRELAHLISCEDGVGTCNDMEVWDEQTTRNFRRLFPIRLESDVVCPCKEHDGWGNCSFSRVSTVSS